MDLSIGQLKIIRKLLELSDSSKYNPLELNCSQLAEKLGLDNSYLARTLKLLEAKKVIRKRKGFDFNQDFLNYISAS